MNFNFPQKAWMPFCIKPSDRLLNSLHQREFLRLRRKGMDRRLAGLESDALDLRSKYSLPTEKNRVKLTPKEWDDYVKMGVREQRDYQRRVWIEKGLDCP